MPPTFPVSILAQVEGRAASCFDPGRTAFIGTAVACDLLSIANGTHRMAEWDSSFFNAASCGHVEVVRHLVGQCGANVDEADTHGQTVLMVAAGRGHVEVVRCLVGKFGVKVTDIRGPSALIFAAGGGHVDVVRSIRSEC